MINLKIVPNNPSCSVSVAIFGMNPRHGRFKRRAFSFLNGVCSVSGLQRSVVRRLGKLPRGHFLPLEKK